MWKLICSSANSQGSRLVVTKEVEHALETGSKEVIALETAIVTHGMPHPTNIHTALSLESIIRSESNNTAIPATIGLISGRVHIGLSKADLEYLGTFDVPNKKKSVKVSRRDLAVAVAQGLDGGTTVAGTMLLSDQVGIEMFVTGGIGGVHRGAERSKPHHNIQVFRPTFTLILFFPHRPR